MGEGERSGIIIIIDFWIIEYEYLMEKVRLQFFGSGGVGLGRDRENREAGTGRERFWGSRMLDV